MYHHLIISPLDTQSPAFPNRDQSDQITTLLRLGSVSMIVARARAGGTSALGMFAAYRKPGPNVAFLHTEAARHRALAVEAYLDECERAWKGEGRG